MLEHFPDAEEVFTRGPGDATRATREALRGGARLVLGVGGDGTNNEVINGFFDEAGAPLAPQACFGFLPRGTGCDLARYLGIPRGDLQAAARLLAGSPSWPMDVGQLEVTTAEGGTARHFWLNIMDFGLGGLVSSRVNRSSKLFGGFVSFLWHTLVSLAIYRDQPMEIDVVGGESLRGVFRSVVLANGKYFGGGMNINAGAVPDDGCFDLLTLPAEGLLHYVAWLPRLYSEKGVLDHPMIHHQRVREIRARAADPRAEIWVQMDGESPGKLPITVRVLPGAVRILAPYPGDTRGNTHLSSP